MLTTRMSPQVTCSLNDSSLEKFYKLERSLKFNGVGETKQVIQQRLLLIFELFFFFLYELLLGSTHFWSSSLKWPFEELHDVHLIAL